MTWSNLERGNDHKIQKPGSPAPPGASNIGQIDEYTGFSFRPFVDGAPHGKTNLSERICPSGWVLATESPDGDSCEEGGGRRWRRVKP